MVVPLIIIGVLFFITWIVIGVSAPVSVPSECYKSHELYPDPFHRCEYTELKYKHDRLQAENDRLRSDLRTYQMRERDYTVPKVDTNAILELLKDQKSLPDELKINNKNYKAKK